jgi:hypothetical protein
VPSLHPNFDFGPLLSVLTLTDLVANLFWTAVDVAWAKSHVRASYTLETITVALFALSCVLGGVVAWRGGGLMMVSVSLCCCVWSVSDLAYMAKGFGDMPVPWLPDVFFFFTALLYALYLWASSELACAVRGLLRWPRALVRDDPADHLARVLRQYRGGPAASAASFSLAEGDHDDPHRESAVAAAADDDLVVRVRPLSRSDAMVLCDTSAIITWIFFDFCWYRLWAWPTLGGAVLCLLSQVVAVPVADSTPLRASYLATVFWVLGDILWFAHDFKVIEGWWAFCWASFALSFAMVLAAFSLGIVQGISLTGMFGRIRKRRARRQPKGFKEMEVELTEAGEE